MRWAVLGLSLLLGACATGQDRFEERVKTADVAEIRDEIAQGIDVNHIYSQGTTALITAAIYNPEPAVVKTLIDNGANPNVKDELGRTALLWAAYYNPNPNTILTLIRGGADLKIRDNKGASPLLLAAVNNPNPQVLEVLVKEGNSPNERDSIGKPPLFYAIAKNRPVEIAKVLLDKGAKVNDGYNTVERGVNQENSPLITAVSSNADISIVKLLIERGANVNQKAKAVTEYQGRKETVTYTPLYVAAVRTTNPEVIKLLMKSGAKDGVNETKLDAFMTAIGAGRRVEIIKAFVESGADINKKYWDNVTPLMLALGSPLTNVENVNYLISVGADESVKAPDGMSLKEVAAHNKRLNGATIKWSK